MTKRRDPAVVIPIVLNVLVLAVFPIFAHREGPSRAIPISLIALAVPWVLYVVIGRLVKGTVSKEVEKRREEEGDGFV